MKILKKFISSKNGNGRIRIVPTENEDMWHLYNLISQGDFITASTVRNVVRESQTGSVDKSRMRMTLKIQIEVIEFDTEQCSIRLKGRNVEENEFVKMGQYHTLELEADHPFWLEKECWDSIYLERLNEAADPSKKADLAAVVIQEGLAHVCLVTSAMTITKSRIERNIPKKRQGNNQHSKAIQNFFEEIYQAILKNLNFEIVKVVMIGSPGFLKDDFYQFMMESAERREHRVLLSNKSKFLRVHASSGHKRAIEELLGNEELRGQLADVKAVKEVRALENFYTTLSADEDRARYGFESVVSANEQLAVQDLLVTDTLFRANDFGVRKKYVDLVESVKANGGQVFIFSGMHVSGEQLDQYTGVAATLRFPIPEELVYDEHYEENNDDNNEVNLKSPSNIDSDDSALFL